MATEREALIADFVARFTMKMLNRLVIFGSGGSYHGAIFNWGFLIEKVKKSGE